MIRQNKEEEINMSDIKTSAKNVASGIGSFLLNPENIHKFILGYKNGQPRAAYDIYRDHRELPKDKKKKKSKKKHSKSYDPYLVLPVKKKKKRKK